MKINRFAPPKPLQPQGPASPAGGAPVRPASIEPRRGNTAGHTGLKDQTAKAFQRFQAERARMFQSMKTNQPPIPERPDLPQEMKNLDGNTDRFEAPRDLDTVGDVLDVVEAVTQDIPERESHADFQPYLPVRDWINERFGDNSLAQTELLGRPALDYIRGGVHHVMTGGGVGELVADGFGAIQGNERQQDEFVSALWDVAGTFIAGQGGRIGEGVVSIMDAVTDDRGAATGTPGGGSGSGGSSSGIGGGGAGAPAQPRVTSGGEREPRPTGDGGGAAETTTEPPPAQPTGQATSPGGPTGQVSEGLGYEQTAIYPDGTTVTENLLPDPETGGQGQGGDDVGVRSKLNRGPSVLGHEQLVALHGPQRGSGGLEVMPTTAGTDDKERPQVGSRSTAKPNDSGDLGERGYLSRFGAGGSIGRGATDDLPLPDDIRPMPRKD